MMLSHLFTQEQKLSILVRTLQAEVAEKDVALGVANADRAAAQRAAEVAKAELSSARQEVELVSKQKADVEEAMNRVQEYLIQTEDRFVRTKNRAVMSEKRAAAADARAAVGLADMVATRGHVTFLERQLDELSRICSQAAASQRAAERNADELRHDLGDAREAAAKEKARADEAEAALRAERIMSSRCAGGSRYSRQMAELEHAMAWRDLHAAFSAQRSRQMREADALAGQIDLAMLHVAARRDLMFSADLGMACSLIHGAAYSADLRRSLTDEQLLADIRTARGHDDAVAQAQRAVEEHAEAERAASARHGAAREERAGRAATTAPPAPVPACAPAGATQQTLNWRPTAAADDATADDALRASSRHGSVESGMGVPIILVSVPLVTAVSDGGASTPPSSASYSPPASSTGSTRDHDSTVACAHVDAEVHATTAEPIRAGGGRRKRRSRRRN